MLKHVVMWKFSDNALGQSRSENVKSMKEQLESIVGIIPEIKSMEVGINDIPSDASYDIVLITMFEDEKSLKIYNEHPEHQKVAAFCAKVRESRVVVDFYL